MSSRVRGPRDAREPLTQGLFLHSCQTPSCRTCFLPQTLPWASCFLGLCCEHVQAKSAQLWAAGRQVGRPLLALSSSSATANAGWKPPGLLGERPAAGEPGARSVPGGKRVRAREQQQTQRLLCVCRVSRSLTSIGPVFITTLSHFTNGAERLGACPRQMAITSSSGLDPGGFVNSLWPQTQLLPTATAASGEDFTCLLPIPHPRLSLSNLSLSVSTLAASPWVSAG